jgi:3',5'-cyclic AMP phosphodiesterase CpdA
MKKLRALAHISDLHIGRSPATDQRAARLCERLLEEGIDQVVVTGDVTHRGRREELDRFRRLFAPLACRLTVVPGNHDGLGDDVRGDILGRRVDTCVRPGLYLVRFDSTGPHNRGWITGHGLMTDEDIALISEALARAPEGSLTALLMHHHVLPLPGDDAIERLFSRLGWPFAEELPLGRRLLETIAGRCDLVLHGHRHRPGRITLFSEGPRPLSVYNAGCSTSLGAARVFQHRGGWLRGAPGWVFADGSRQADPGFDSEFPIVASALTAR